MINSDSITCQFCDGARPVRHNRCAGCGTPVTEARVSPAKLKHKVKCPQCGSGYHKQFPGPRFTCQRCFCHYELPDFHFVDTRPMRNAEKLGL